MKPEWRRRYDEANPRVTVRLTASLRKILDDLRKEEGLSFADLIKTGLKAAGDEKAAYQKGWDDAKGRYAITVPCSRCKKPMELSMDTDMCKAAAYYLQEKNWHHGECP